MINVTRVQSGTTPPTDTEPPTIGVLTCDEPPIITAFENGLIGRNNTIDACAETNFHTKYHNGSGSYPIIGDYVYDDQLGTIPYDGNNKYFGTDTGQVIQINDTGYVLDSNQCA